MIIEINKTLNKSEREDVYEIVNLLVNLDPEVKKKILYMMLGMELLGATEDQKQKNVVNNWCYINKEKWKSD